MQCIRIKEWGGNLELAEVPIPEAGTDEVLIDVEATSVGRTVHNSIAGQTAGSTDPLPLIPGHEIVGRVTERGPGVTGIEIGDRVASYYYLTCGDCRACRRGDESLCESIRGRVGVSIDGGFAEFTRLPATNVIKLPDIDPVDATVVPDAVATPLHVAKRRAKIQTGDEVMIIGAGGGVGIHLVQVADLFGASVTAVDLNDNKLEKCAELGAAHTVNTRDESLRAFAEREGLRYDSIVDFVGDKNLLEESLNLLGPRGRLVNLTAFQGRTFELSPRQIVSRETEVVGSRYCSKHELAEAAELVADGEVEPVVSEVVSLEGVPELLEKIASDDLLGRGAVVP